MRPWLSDAWSLLALAFGQVVLTVAYIALVPYGYLTQKAERDEEVAAKLEELSRYATQRSGEEITWIELLNDQRPTIQGLLEVLPGVWLVVAASAIIYPFLGWWASRWLHHPELSGLLILGSIGTQQNIVLIPRNIEYMNVAPISLSLPVVMAIIVLQYALLVAGIMGQRGQALIQKEKEKQNELQGD